MVSASKPGEIQGGGQGDPSVKTRLCPSCDIMDLNGELLDHLMWSMDTKVIDDLQLTIQLGLFTCALEHLFIVELYYVLSLSRVQWILFPLKIRSLRSRFNS